MDFNQGLEQYRLALKYKSTGAYKKAVEILGKTITELNKSKNHSDKVHLVPILKDELTTIYIEMDERE